MLREMGIPLWAPGEAGDAPAAPASPATPAPAVAAPEDRASAAAPPRRSAETAPSAPRWPGPAPADWLVLSDPLDEHDPQQAQLLENMLRAIGVGMVAPARDRRAVFWPIVGGPAADMAAGAAALTGAIDTVAPRCVLALGRAAAAALLGDDVPLGGLRGRVHDRAGLPVVVTFSLAFLLRHPAEKAKAWADLCLAVGATLLEDEPRRTPR